MSKFYCIIKRLLEVWTTLISEIQYVVNSISNIISWEEVQCWWQKTKTPSGKPIKSWGYCCWQSRYCFPQTIPSSAPQRSLSLTLVTHPVLAIRARGLIFSQLICQWEKFTFILAWNFILAAHDRRDIQRIGIFKMREGRRNRACERDLKQ